MQAGLGGGSSNAAFVLKGLNKIFKFPLKEKELFSIASKIGSDVPFFLYGGICSGAGRGERLKKINVNFPLKLKIIKLKNLSVSTKWAYDELDKKSYLNLEKKEKLANIKSALKKKNKSLLLENIFNDFEDVIFFSPRYKELVQKRDSLLKKYKSVHLCGSGSALFVIP